jgi:hypothetical protein
MGSSVWVGLVASPQDAAGNNNTASATFDSVSVTTGPLAIGIFGTGVASAGVLAADGSVDAHYRLVGSPDSGYPGPNAIVVTSASAPIPPWVGQGPNSKWIASRGDAGNGNASGTYTYRTTFDLTGLNPPTAVLTGQFASDNGAIIKLNGVTVGPSSSGYNAFTTFTINSGFIVGVNTLDFVVTNDPCSGCINPTGLRVDISGTASP